MQRAIKAPAVVRSDFSTGLRWSMYLHGGVIVFVVLKSLVFPSTPKVFAPALRVDLVGLPDLLKKDLTTLPKPKDASLPPPPAEKKGADAAPEKADPGEMVLKPKKTTEETPKNREKKLRSALDRIKALEKIQSSEREDARRKAREAAIPLLKGNIISKGSSLSGAARESAEASYYDEVRERIQGNWELNVLLARQKLSARVQIFVDARGKIQNYKITQTSGNHAFDEAVRRTLAKSQPLPAPPPEIAEGVLADGISVGFPL